MADAENKTDFDIKTLVNDHGKDISGISEKLSRCYSEDRYQKFQDDVEKIVLKTIDGDGREKIKAHAKESAKEYNDGITKENKNEGWDKLKFWVPTFISIVALGVSIYLNTSKKEDIPSSPTTTATVQSATH